MVEARRERAAVSRCPAPPSPTEPRRSHTAPQPHCRTAPYHTVPHRVQHFGHGDEGEVEGDQVHGGAADVGQPQRTQVGALHHPHTRVGAHTLRHLVEGWARRAAGPKACRGAASSGGAGPELAGGSEAIGSRRGGGVGRATSAALASQSAKQAGPPPAPEGSPTPSSHPTPLHPTPPHPTPAAPGRTPRPPPPPPRRRAAAGSR